MVVLSMIDIDSDIIIDVALSRDQCSIKRKFIPANQLIASSLKPRNSHLIDTRN